MVTVQPARSSAEVEPRLLNKTMADLAIGDRVQVGTACFAARRIALPLTSSPCDHGACLKMCLT